MSVGVVDKSTGERIQTAGDLLDKVGNLANLTTSAKANAVEAINEVNAGKANQTQLATVEASTTASKPYSAGEYLVLGGVLYKVTANIAQGGTIVTEGAGKNVDLATVGGELATLKSGLTSVSGKVPIRGSFAVQCVAGVNNFNRNTMEYTGNLPTASFTQCLMTIVNHSDTANSPNTIECDTSDNLLINSVSGQTLTVLWLDISNIPIAND